MAAKKGQRKATRYRDIAAELQKEIRLGSTPVGACAGGVVGCAAGGSGIGRCSGAVVVGGVGAVVAGVVGAVVVGVVGAVVVGVVGAVVVAAGAVVVAGAVGAVDCSAFAVTFEMLAPFRLLISVDSVSIDITGSPDACAIVIAWLFGYTSSFPERSPA